MRTKRLGKTGLLVSELGFGGFAIGGERSGNSYGATDDSTSLAAIRTSLEHGCTFFDTADVYGYGKSEELIGRALRDAGCLDDVVIAGKVGGNFDSGRTVPDFSRRHITAAIDASLRRLGRDHLDLYQLHDPPLAAIRRGEAFEVLDELVAAGKIRHHGASIHRVEEGEACLGAAVVKAIQMTYNLFSLLEPELSPMPLFGATARHDVGLIARQPLAAGFLSGRHDRETVYENSDLRGQWPPRLRRVYLTLADALRHLERPEASLAQVALRFTLDEPAIATTIVGIKTPEQARENFAATKLPSFEQLCASAAAA